MNIINQSDFVIEKIRSSLLYVSKYKTTINVILIYLLFRLMFLLFIVKLLLTKKHLAINNYAYKQEY